MVRRLCCLALLVCPIADAQEISTAPLMEELAEVHLDSGYLQSAGGSSAILYSSVVKIPGASWMRLCIEDSLLPVDPQSGESAWLLITSEADGGAQRLDAESLRQWGNTTAYFNGDSVRVELVASGGAGPCRVLIRRAIFNGETPAEPRSICPPTDDRLFSSDPRVARALPIGCSVFLIDDPTHGFLTAGHCAESSFGNAVIEFNVPLSDSGGTVQHPPPEDQYAVDPVSIQGTDGGIGNDWAFFGAFRNPNTGLTPYQAQQDYFTLAQIAPPVSGQSIRITGYGTASPGLMSQVQKTHSGPYISHSGTALGYRTDTTGGNSGSPVIHDGTQEVVGIHTHAGCDSTTGFNQGTAIEHASLQSALANPRGVTDLHTHCTLSADVNLDGKVNGRDIRTFIHAVVEGSQDPAEACAADLNGDDQLSLEDAALLACRLVGSCN